MGEIDFSLKGKKIASHIASNSGTILCALLIVVNVIYRCIADGSFNRETALNFGTEAIIYIASAWLCWLTCHGNGKMEGKNEKIYTDAVKAYNDIRARLMCKSKEIAAWCHAYSIEDLKQRQRDILLPNDVDVETYAKWRGKRFLAFAAKRDLMFYQRKAIRRARRLKPIALTAARLLIGYDVRQRNSLSPKPYAVDATKTVTSLTKIFITSVFIVNISISVKMVDNIFLAVLTGIVTCLPLVWTCYTGYHSGHKFITKTATDYMNEQIDFLRLFEEDNKKKEAAE